MQLVNLFRSITRAAFGNSKNQCYQPWSFHFEKITYLPAFVARKFRVLILLILPRNTQKVGNTGNRRQSFEKSKTSTTIYYTSSIHFLLCFRRRSGCWRSMRFGNSFESFRRLRKGGWLLQVQLLVLLRLKYYEKVQLNFKCIL